MRSGFSLVELSIVLVILGLLTGGILTGQTLIRAAELRAITTEYQNFQSATQTFRDKYFALPGDMRNAAQFWVAPNAAVSGDGDGIINAGTTGTNSGENFQYWRHLALSGLIEGTYTGSSVGGTDGASFGDNVPRSKLSNAGWSIFTEAMAGNTALEFTTPEYGNGLSFGAAATNAPALNDALKPEEAWNIDTKVDDGQPSQGAIIGYPFTDTECVDSTGATDTTADYQLDNEATTCALIFSRQF